uniref:Uncharacterized protein n=1 Tax=Pseudonaja textilis TaxID=8673 RepID=A0A670XQV0_PSETE
MGRKLTSPRLRPKSIRGAGLSSTSFTPASARNMKGAPNWASPG